MSELKQRHMFDRMDRLEGALCILCNRACSRRRIRRFFASVSRLGDGVFWYALMIAIPVAHGAAGIAASLHMGPVAVACLITYKVLKPRMVRQRPFIRHAGINLGTTPLDYYSFPSGHTLHAVAFSIVAIAWYPVLAWLVVPFTLLVAASRVVLGLHYPSDVLAGAAIGAGIAAASFAVLG